VSDFLRFKF